MNDGYYISIYANISEIGNLYCISERHDNSIALWKKNGLEIDLVHYWELERISGLKQQGMSFFDIEHCKSEINKLISRYSITIEDVQEIWGVPDLQPDNDKYLSKHRFPEYTYHSFSHLSSCIFMDTDIFRNENILGFAVDGGSDKTIDQYDADVDQFNKKGTSEVYKQPFIGWYSKGNEADPKVYSAYTPALIWGHIARHFLMREGTLMALASASTSEAYEEFDDILLDTTIDYGEILFPQINKIIDHVEELSDKDIGIKFNGFDKRFSEKDNKISMVMKIIQKMSYSIMERNIERAIALYNVKPEETYLAMSGGFALNCPCNTYLMDKYGFKGFIAPPCVNDSGMALGIGLYSFYQGTDGKFNFKLKNAYYGDSDNIEDFLLSGTKNNFIEKTSDFNAVEAARDIVREPIIWFDGRAELGPRALGSRSLLGDPRQKETKDKLNEIKLRQWWRPVAPIAKAESMKDWFCGEYDSPYMLHAFQVKEDKKELIPSIIHEDGSARVQSLEANNDRLRQVLDEFENLTGIPIICNTSLNDKGEPIINTIEEAFNFALRKGIKIGYFNGKRIQFKNHNEYSEEKPLKRPLRMAIWKDKDEWQKLIDIYNPLEIPDTLIYARYKFGFLKQSKGILKNTHELKRELLILKMFLKKESYLREADMEINEFVCKEILQKYLSE